MRPIYSGNPGCRAGKTAFGIHHLTEGQKILLHVTDEGKGPQAKEIKVFATE